MKHTHYSDLNRDGYVRFKLDDDIIKGIENSSIIRKSISSKSDCIIYLLHLK